MKQLIFLFFFMSLAGLTSAQYYKNNTVAGTPPTLGNWSDAYNNLSATVVPAMRPYSAIVDVNGNIYFSDDQGLIKKVDKATGAITRVAGGGTFSGTLAAGQLATNTLLVTIRQLAFDANGDIVFAEQTSNAGFGFLRKLNLTTNRLETVIGGGSDPFGTLSNTVKLNSIYGVAVNTFTNNIYFSEQGAHVVRVYNPTTGSVTVIAGIVNDTGAYNISQENATATTVKLKTPNGLAIDGLGNIYLADDGEEQDNVRKIDTNGLITKIAGNVQTGYNVNDEGGLAKNAQLQDPFGVAVDKYGNVFIADKVNSLIRKIDTQGKIWTIAGLVQNGAIASGYLASAEGGLATLAPLKTPMSVFVDQYQDLYITEYGNHIVRKLPIFYITKNPSSTTVCEGTVATFTLQTSSASETPTYQWQVNAGTGTFTNLVNDAVYAGVNTATLTVNATVTLNLYEYRCFIVVSGKNETSTIATLTVNTHGSITLNPLSGTVCSGTTYSLKTQATGLGIAYVWYENTGTGFALNNTSTGTTLTLTTVSAAMNGFTYVCVVSNTCYSQTSTVATLTVHTTGSITLQPLSQSFCTTGVYTATIAATGLGLAYQWYENTGSGFILKPGGTTVTLSLGTVNAGMNGFTYVCVVSNTCYSQTSTVATLTVATTGSITVSPLSAAVCSGTSHSFFTQATGSALTYKWYENTGSGFVLNVTITTATLTLASVTPSMTGFSYLCVVSNTCYVETSTVATLTVHSTGSITLQPLSQSFCTTGVYTATVAAAGLLLTYQWYENTGAGFVIKPGATTATLSLGTINSSMNGFSYRCVVSNTCYVETSTVANLTVHTTGSITLHPVGGIVCNQTAPSLTANATGVGVAYQWYENTGTGFALKAGATSSSFALGTVNAGMNGWGYLCVVSNTCYVETSTIATLTVMSAGVINTQPVSVSLCEGLPVSFSIQATGISLSYQWYKKDISSGVFLPISSAVQSNVSIASVTLSDQATSYLCTVSNTCAVVSSTIANLTVKKKPNLPVIQIVGNSSGIKVNELVSLSVLQEPNVTYVWQANQVALGIGANLPFSTTLLGTYVINTLATAVDGGCQNTSTNVTLTVSVFSASVTFNGNPVICEEGTLNLTAITDATNTDFTYQWFQNNNVLTDNSATRKIYEASQAGMYQAKVYRNGTEVATQQVNVSVVAATPNDNINIVTSTGLKTILRGKELKLTVLQKADHYDWTPTKALVSVLDNSSVTAAPTQTTNYRVMMRGKDLCTIAQIMISVITPAQVDTLLDAESEKMLKLPQIYRPSVVGERNAIVPVLEYETDGICVFSVMDVLGNSVYHNDDYKNDWDMVSKVNNRPLIPGTYFYKVVYVSAKGVKRWWQGFFDMLN